MVVFAFTLKLLHGFVVSSWAGNVRTKKSYREAEMTTKSCFCKGNNDWAGCVEGASGEGRSTRRSEQEPEGDRAGRCPLQQGAVTEELSSFGDSN